MPNNSIKIDSATIENWNYYLKLHSTDDYRILAMRDLERELQKLMKDYEKRMQLVYEVFNAIAPHYIGRFADTTTLIIDMPEYRAIAYEEISACIIYWDGERARWKDPITDVEYEKAGATFVKAGQYVFENFFEETFYQYAVKKAIYAGQSLREKEMFLKRQADRNQRLGRKPPLTKYNVVRQTRKIATKQGCYVTKFLEYYNKQFIALPLAAWTNVFTLGGAIPEETDFRNSIKELISKYLKGALSELKDSPLYLHKQIIPEQND